MHELRQRIGKDTYDIVGITETWFTPEIRDAELTLEGFDIFRVDRQNESYERGGGVVLYINNELNHQNWKRSVLLNLKTWYGVG